MKGTAEERFRAKADKAPGYGPWGDCVRWTGALGSGGYGMLRVGNDTIRAHRFSYELEFGPIPELGEDGEPIRLCVCHRCDTPDCVNPDHLFLGTQGDNMKDMVSKGRTGAAGRWRRVAEGRRQGSREYSGPKLDQDQVDAIRAARSLEGKTLRELGEIYGVSRQMIHLVVTEKAWR